MKNEIRLNTISIEYDKEISLEYISKLKYFLNESHHLDFALQIIISNKFLDFENFYGLVSILSTLEFPHNLILRSTMEGLDEKISNLIYHIFDHVTLIVEDNFEEKLKDENIIFLASKKEKFNVELKVNENTIHSAKRFFEVFSFMNISHIMKIDYFHEVKDYNNFVQNFADAVRYIEGVLYIKNNPMLELFLLDDGTIRTFNHKKSAIVTDLNEGYDVDFSIYENEQQSIDKILKRCDTCANLKICKGGPSELFFETDNENLFCMTQNLIREALEG